MKLKKTDIKDLIIISHDKYSDNRGYFKELFRKNDLEDTLGYKINFCQDNSVVSHKNVLRGLHYQNEPNVQSKLISVIHGEILDVVVDLRETSSTYGKSFSLILSAKNNQSLFIAKGFAHGYLTLSEKAIVNYKVDNYYNKETERGIMYNDEFLDINWGINEKDLIISKKDKKHKPFKWKKV